MTNRPPHPDTGDDTDAGVGPDRGTTSPAHRMPRWVKAFAIIGMVLVLLVVVKLLIGGGHGPARHMGARGDTAPLGSQQNLGRIGWPADPAERARTVPATTLDAMTVELGRIKVSAGETVMFVVTNTGQAVHEFTLGDAAVQQEHAETGVQQA